jgi:hypothetical protein
MDQQGVSTKALADAVGLSEKKINLKMEGVLDWALSEAIAVCRYLNYPDLKTLFLP